MILYSGMVARLGQIVLKILSVLYFQILKILPLDFEIVPTILRLWSDIIISTKTAKYYSNIDNSSCSGVVTLSS